LAQEEARLDAGLFLMGVFSQEPDLYQGMTSQAAEKLGRVVGRGFIPGVSAMNSAWL
jgi:hypothetical protein